jgi:hypothetical protein
MSYSRKTKVLRYDYRLDTLLSREPPPLLRILVYSLILNYIFKTILTSFSLMHQAPRSHSLHNLQFLFIRLLIFCCTLH